MFGPNVRLQIDPLAHKAAIDALEAQRAAYRRYARTMEAQQATINSGDGDRATAVADAAVRGFDELQLGAQRLQPLVEHVYDAGSPDQLLEMQRQMEDLMQEARVAEAAIQNMTVQLEAWRDAYGRQLAEVGLVPGAGDGAGEQPAAELGSGYGPWGTAPAAPGRRGPSVIDRKG